MATRGCAGSVLMEQGIGVGKVASKTGGRSCTATCSGEDKLLL